MIKVRRSFSLRGLLAAGLLLIGVCARSVFAEAGQSKETNYCFFVAGDMRNFVSGTAERRFFDGACMAMKDAGPGAFLLSPGDCDPAAPVRAEIDRYLGTNFLWYPLVGNHDVETPARTEWFQQWAKNGIPHLTRSGPPGDESLIYSFDYANSHLIMLDEYMVGQPGGGNLPDAELAWLKQDLAANHQPFTWVSGHKPIQSLPDMDSGRLRHAGESISTIPERREKFLALLRKYHVTAYICGHTHNCSITKLDGVWQLDSGHSRGGGDSASLSTFLKIQMNGPHATVDVYRSNTNGLNYKVTRTVELK